MSRSRRKTPIVAFCNNSSGAVKKWKKEYNRAMRRCKDEEHPKKNEYATEWDSPRDGKMYLGKPVKEWQKKALRK